MTTSAPKTLFIPMLDFAADIENEMNRWFDRDHVPERLSCEGFVDCERYQLTSIEPPGWNPQVRWYKYLNIYTVQSPAVLQSQAYRLQTTRPAGRWMTRRQELDTAAGRGDLYARRSSTRRWSMRSLWTQRASPWPASAVSMPPPRTLYVLLRDVEAAHADAVNRYLDEEAVPELLTCPGFLRCERYQASAQAALPIDGKPAALEQPRYMDIYEVETPEVLDSEAFWIRQSAPSERGQALAARITLKGVGVYLQRPSPWALRVN